MVLHQPPWSVHLGASYTYLPLGFRFHCEAVALEGVHRFPHSLAEKHVCAEYVVKMRNQCSSYVIFYDLQKPSQDEWGETQDTTKATVGPEEKLKQALLF
ncbi:unnamed protein product [Gulo gulo]|uniref:Ferritin light chain n=1 Tax=Gulo gulo TaxID=48420 RepID=A0A9X9LWQ2_GULGU|nr:unnamed protein product [Gulo gulo]